MLYYKCPTCKTLLANKQIPFEREMEKICNNKNLSKAEMDKQKQDLLDRLELKRYCCRMRILTYLKRIEIVK